MLCPNCKTENDDAANFCTNCRTSLKEAAPAEPAVAPAEPAVAPAETQPEAQSEAPAVETDSLAAATAATEAVATTLDAAPAAPAAKAPTASGNPNFFAVMVAGVIKPMTTFKENLPKFEAIKNAIIISIIVAVMSTILSTITSVVGIVRSEECVENCGSSFSSLFSDSDEKKDKKIETKWEWDNLKNYDWFKSVGQSLLLNVLTIAILSGAYFGVAKAFKSKKANFGRMMTVVAIGLIPTIIVTFLAPMIGAINLTFAGILSAAAIVYSFSIILTGLNEEAGLEGDKKVYLNILSIAAIALAYYIVFRVMCGGKADLIFNGLFSMGGGSSSLFNMGGSSSSSSDLLKNLDLDLDF